MSTITVTDAYRVTMAISHLQQFVLDDLLQATDCTQPLCQSVCQWLVAQDYLQGGAEGTWQLQKPLDLLEIDCLSELQGPCHHLTLHLSVPSTNDFLMAASPPPLGQLDVCVAAHQTQSRGQRGRVWQAQLGHGFWFSLAWQGAIHFYDPGAVTQLFMLEVADLLCQRGVQHIALKWPNDLYIGHQKLGGVLLETSLQANHTLGHFVLGMGINWQMPEYLDRPVAGLASQVMPAWSYHQVMVDLLQCCIALYSKMQTDMTMLLAQLPARWQAYEMKGLQ